MPSDAPANSKPSQLVPDGTKLGGGRYVVKQALGVGGMAEVYVAEHVALRKPVALKVLRPEFAALPEFRQRFLREGLAASSIRHPHIVDVTDVGEEADWVYLVMELLEGETLGGLMNRQGAIPVAKAVDLMLPVIAALGAAHRAGVVHRDMKPENVFLARDAQGRTFPKVLDFGISKSTREDVPSLTATETVLGTPHYMSPEQARGETEIGGASDQFSTAMVLYELCTGRLPYQADTTLRLIHEVARGDVPPPSALSSSLFDLDAPMKKALANEPRERHATIEAFGVALLPLASERARAEWTAALEGRAATPSVPPPKEGERGSGRHVPAPTAPQRAGALTPRPSQAGSGPRPRTGEHAQREEETRSSEADGPLTPPARPIAIQSTRPTAAERPSKETARPKGGKAEKNRDDPTPIETKRPPRGRKKADGEISAPRVVSEELEAKHSAEMEARQAAARSQAAPRRTGLYAAIGLVALLAIGLFVFGQGATTADVVVAPESAEVRLDGELVSARPVPVPLDGRGHRLEIEAAGFTSRTLEIGPGDAPPSSIALDHAAPEPPPPEPPAPVVEPVREPPVAVEPVVAPPVEPVEPVVEPPPSEPTVRRTGRTPRVRDTHPPPPDRSGAGDLRVRR